LLKTNYILALLRKKEKESPL